MGVFEKRVAFKPFEYPDIIAYKDAINHSYWLVSEFNFIADVQDFKVQLTDVEKNAIKNAMLAISQIEISVKRFWTKLGDRFPKAEFDQVGVSFGECHIDGTEVLTPNGWVDFKDVNIGDDVMQFHSDNNTFTITKVKAKFDDSYNGEIYKFSKKNTAVYVTPNHRMLYYDIKGNAKESLAENFKIYRGSNERIPEAGKINNTGLNDLSFMERLRIALQADGHRRYYDSGYGKKFRKSNGLGAEYDIGVKRPRKIKRLDWILKNLADDPTVRWIKRPAKDREGYFYYTIQIDAEYDYKEFDWVNLYEKTDVWCENFIQEVANWDSTRCKGKKDCLVKFGSTNKRAIDKVQMIGVAAGYRTNVYTSRKEGYKDGHILSFTKNRERVSISPLNLEKIDYTGTVRCITVDSGAIITRYKNKTFISGNSEVRHADAYSHLLEVLGFNDEFTQLLQNPVIQGRVDYLTKYLKGASDNSDENYTLTLTLFSIFIENVSLFSQFLIIKSFNKYKNVLKDIDSIVNSTRLEEHLHAMFGVELTKIIQKENPSWFDEDFYVKIYRACQKAYTAECAIIDWIFEKGELDFLHKDVVIEFIKNRFNESLELIGGKKVFEVDKEKLKQVRWFDDELHAEVSNDFFHKKSFAYNKRSKPITADDIF